MKDITGRSGGPQAVEEPEPGPVAEPPPVPARIVPAAFEEPLRIDPARIGELVADMGPEAAQLTVARAIDTLEHRLIELERAAAGSPAHRAKAARRLVGIAGGIGLVTLAEAARGAAQAALADDAVALAATTARLGRIGARSLQAIREANVL